MSEAYTGGCACGAIRYEIAGEPVFSNHCRCRDCQLKSGTGHDAYLTFKREGENLTGAPKLWYITADSGNVKTRVFCPTCGAPVTLTFTAMPQVFTVHAASLDDPARFQPQVVSYGARGYDWDPIDPKLTVFAAMPQR